ncbi:molybdopterin-dependent oxidoreductase [Mameliella alba]|nr:molybdopterin-dependent oxidoreductase [Antarctobacter heliothermus]MBY6146398.1 molybdopterin-dependent oxidoreductase [Mameliella alba]MCA0955797.1 molybdopterin-dependent oxidoreductase [Mameliella alba]
MTTRRVLCSGCDIYCQVEAEVPDSGLVADVRVKAIDPRPLRANICMKGVHAPEGFAHPNRLLYPLRRAGARGDGKWQQVSWDEALDDIAARLGAIVNRHGPEAFAVSTSQWNTQTDNGMARRFMNLLGSPNWISGVAMCAGNTAAINRLVYGWYPYPDYPNTQCVVLFGHNPKAHSWTPVHNAIRRAQERGAKVIVLDPRRSENAELADLWLPLKPGTDAAMCLGWLKVILDEGLYDADFVAQWTVGFDSFRKRIDAYPLDRVARITGVDAHLIAQAARIYATSTPAVIPWTPITDQQRNSTSAIRLMCILRAICGNLDVKGGEILHGFHPDFISETELERHDALSDAQRAKQLGSEDHPAFTYRAADMLKEPARRVWGHDYPNLVNGSCMAVPSAVFRAMADGDPYPVKAFFTLGNNTLLSYANMQLIHRALMAQDLVVAVEHFKTPTAQLADYILPGDAWLERNAISDSFAWTAIYRTSQKTVEAPGECRPVYDFWHGLAHRMGLGDAFPWPTQDALLDHRVQKLAPDFASFAEDHAYHMPRMAYRKYERTGFATPSGKVELASGILDELGFDPLPGWRPDPPADPDWPLTLFTGVREDAFFQTGHRHIASLRKRQPEPQAFVSVEDARALGIAAGDDLEVATRQGRVLLKAAVRDDMPTGVVRVPHGWWLPERPEGDGSLSGAWDHADAQICPDDPDHVDREQGIPHLKGIACRVTRLS